MNIENISLEQITPLHEPQSSQHLQDIVDDMRENGWRGGPLLVIERAGDYLAWTGSHRLAAAKDAGFITVPCYVLAESELTSRGFDAEHGHVEDYKRRAILHADSWKVVRQS